MGSRTGRRKGVEGLPLSCDVVLVRGPPGGQVDRFAPRIRVLTLRLVAKLGARFADVLSERGEDGSGCSSFDLEQERPIRLRAGLLDEAKMR